MVVVVEVIDIDLARFAMAREDNIRQPIGYHSGSAGQMQKADVSIPEN
jgi:hypothetical protein